jgi:predicted deacylase
MAMQWINGVFGRRTALPAGGEGYTTSAAPSAGVPSVTAEVFGNGLWHEASVGEMMAGIQRALHHLGMIASLVEPAPQAAPQVVTMWVSTGPCDGLWYPAEELSQPVREAEALGETGDVFGRVLGTIRSGPSGRTSSSIASPASQ